VPIKQYINLDPAVAAQLDGLAAARAGKKVRFKATVAPAAAGVRVRFTVTNGDNNRKKPGATKSYTEKTNAQGEAKISFEVSDYGGDEFKVEAKVKDTDQALASETFVVWRRYYLEISRVDQMPKGAGRGGGNIPAVPALDISGDIIPGFGTDHFIELVDKSAHDLIARPVNIHEQGIHHAQAGRVNYAGTQEPVLFRIVHVEAIRTSAVVLVEGPIDNTLAYVSGLGKIWKDPSMPLNADWFIQAWWMVPDPALAVQPWTLINAPLLQLQGESAVELNHNQILNQLPAPARARLNGVEEINVRLQIRRLAGSSGGIQFSNLIVVGAEGDDDAKRKMTVKHELGHALGLVAKGQPDRYTGHGHQGPHCAKGLSAQDKQGASYENKKGTCTMYGEGTPTRTDYCADCKASLRKALKTIPHVTW
jgi:hypothetical protein